MLNKKKQIFSPKPSVRTQKSALFNLPEFSKNSYIQVLDQEGGQVEDINLIFEKILSKRKDSDELDYAFRYSFSNLFFQKHVYLKLFSRQLIAPSKNFKESFIFLKPIVRASLRYNLISSKLTRGGLKILSFGFLSFVPKNLALKKKKLNKSYHLLFVRLFRKKIKRYYKRNFVLKRSKLFRRFDKQKRPTIINLVGCVLKKKE